jgi:multiple sugar transport system permease protein
MATTVQQQAVAAGAKGKSVKRRFNLTPYLFILPHFIFFAVFIGYPFFNGLYISLFRFDYLQPETNVFVGLQNYINIFSSGTVEFQEFWNALRNTVEFVIYSVPLLVVIPLFLAVLLNQKLPGINIFRAIYFAPWVLSVAVVGLLWFWIFQSAGGLVNYYLGALHLPTPDWLASQPWAWISIVVATIWWTMGFNMIILLAALQDIPDQLYEAAAIDGATSWQAFWRVTVPALRPVLLLIVTISIIASFNLFGQPFFMTNGGPPEPSGGGSTEPIMLRIYIDGFVRHFMGTAAAMSFVVAAIMIVISYLNFRLFSSRE